MPERASRNVKKISIASARLAVSSRKENKYRVKLDAGGARLSSLSVTISLTFREFFEFLKRPAQSGQLFNLIYSFI